MRARPCTLPATCVDDAVTDLDVSKAVSTQVAKNATFMGMRGREREAYVTGAAVGVSIAMQFLKQQGILRDVLVGSGIDARVRRQF